MYPDVPYVQLPGKRVVEGAYVYGLSFCTYCAQARAFLEREGYSVKVLLLNRLPAPRRKELQADFATARGAEPIYPVLELDGELYFGFDPDVWRNLFADALAGSTS
jgi:glutaredoxin